MSSIPDVSYGKNVDPGGLIISEVSIPVVLLSVSIVFIPDIIIPISVSFLGFSKSVSVIGIEIFFRILLS